MNTLFKKVTTRTPRTFTTTIKFFSTTAKPQKDWKDKKILVAGCRGQIGSALTQALIADVGAQNVIAADLVEEDSNIQCTYHQLDVTDKATYEKIVKDEEVDYIIHLAAILSSLGEQHPALAYDVNVTGGTNALELARDYNCQIFIPSTIGAFGGTTFQKDQTPDDSILQPSTMYGVSKVFNELLGQYYHDKYGVDFRAIRYPGVISSEKYAFNGTTDYSTEIFFHALESNYYKCWLQKDQALPMIYVDDCIDATMQYLRADKAVLKRTCYNLCGVSFTPEEFVKEVKRLIPDLKVDYEPCERRSAIAAGWPRSLNDVNARNDWGWKYDITTYELCQKILENIAPEYKEAKNICMVEEISEETTHQNEPDFDHRI